MESITLAIVGSGGAGVVSLGELVLKAAAQVGYFGLMRKSFGPQIRGGESAAIIRLSSTKVSNFSGEIHCLLALDWNNFSRFGDEIPVSADTVILQDTQAGELPQAIAPDQVHTLDFTQAAESVGSSKANMALLGYLGKLLKAQHQPLEGLIRKRLAKLNEEQQNISVAAMKAGGELWQQFALELPMPSLKANPDQSSWIATGNQLAGLGVLEAGVRFVAAYPITPASECLEWIANNIEGVGGHLVQAEDELSAVNMIIGAGFAGVPSMTATSGPGLALMSEAMGLSIASETPSVILNVMRGGPSTGIPTKSEQSDFNLAVYGMHGDAPHIVLGANSIEDCYATLSWAVKLASDLQTLVIVLSDQFMGQSMQIMDPLPEVPYKVVSNDSTASLEPGYARYLDTASGVSPMAIPGVANGMYTADGLEHTEGAIPSPKASHHQTQLDKRQRKLDHYDFSEFWGSVHYATDDHNACDKNTLICWGSLTSAAREAQQLLLNEGIPTRLVALRLLLPLPVNKLVPVFDSANHVLVMEQNHQGQFANYLSEHAFANNRFNRLAKPGPSLITPQEISTYFIQQLEEGAQ